MSATLRSNVHVNFLAPDYLDVNDYFKKVDWIGSLNIISKTNHKKIPVSVISFCKGLKNFSTFEGESILERCKEWYHNFYERYCDLQLTERVQHIEEKIYSSQKLSELLQGTTIIKKRSYDDNDDNKAGPSNEKRSRHEDLSCESTTGACFESYQREQDELRILEIETEEPPIEWKFSAPKPNWLDKIAQEQQLLTSALFSNDDTKIRYELSLNPILWKIIDLFDQRTMNLLSENELSELNTTISASLKNWTILEPMAERHLYSLAKVYYKD
ncbi:14125_t:CDS:2 [Ambispora leptoticha]|uniref:14125_t:CDS:1 n=1 Tax=Ambispora leptoticha TaxID=144679 RepID=A0A9N9GJ15_9GLOM|nr:14125_t:CDS:2 [Ambispora leptoticha]